MKIHFATLLILFSIMATIKGQPRATISDDVSICSSGTVYFGIQFEEVDLPVDFRYSIKTEDWEQIVEVVAYFDANYSAAINLTQAATIQLLQFYDANSNQYVPTSNHIMKVSVDIMPSPNAGADVDNIDGLNYQLQGIPENSQNNCYWSPISNGSFDDITNPDATFTANASGSYILTFNEENGACIGHDEVSLSFSGVSTNINENQKTISKRMLLYPNPCSSGIVNLTCKNDEISEVIIYSVSGQYIAKKAVNISEIDVSNLTSGIYVIVAISNDNAVYKETLIVD